ncbi:serine O-acetyltransferase [Paenibacillus eucommiae]|uniref:Serine O-acetyltransferase n=1 Tax=Paenibacillus eucommiae TaxID=1355755 RepID=A0ABS4J391_9BACL|nr:serine acetyltransferase [Paenibacillus eucommiae]MBP1994307.1 serine O-acetyltransferase [Paenibacillus eucommiae]
MSHYGDTGITCNPIQSQFGSLVTAIAESHRDPSHAIPLESSALPNRDTIIDIIHMVRELVFPGYVGQHKQQSGLTIEYGICKLLISIHEKLHEQIVCALHHHKKNKEGSEPDNHSEIEQKAEEIVSKFLSKIPELRGVLATDVQAAFDGDPSAESASEIIFSFPGIFALLVYRFAHELYLLSVPLIPRIMTEYAHNKTGIDIHAGATIGKYFFIDHGTGVVIGETTVIGNGVKIYQGVTLGALSTRGGQKLRGAKRHPTLLDNVTVYAGASILGGDTIIGKDVMIGSNVFLTKSVPDGTRVSMKNPELVFKGKSPQDFEQQFVADWVI